MSNEASTGLVSVVVASYNHAEFLDQRMASLINQTYQNLEILVIDDRSSDNSVEVLRKYEGAPKVRLLVREQNGGWVTVSNQGIGLAAGEFVIFANCDDACEPTMIERLVAAMRQHPSAGIAFCRSVLVDESDRWLGDDFAGRERAFRQQCAIDCLIDGAQMSRFLLHSCVIPNLSAAIFRKTCFASAGVLSSAYRVCCDWDLFFRIAAAHDVAYIATPLNRFRQHKTTIRSATKDQVVYDEYFRLLLGYLRTLPLSFAERCRFRTRVMSLWMVHLSTLSWQGSGIKNFPHHLALVARCDPLALAFFAPAALLRAAQVLGKVLFGRQTLIANS